MFLNMELYEESDSKTFSLIDVFHANKYCSSYSHEKNTILKQWYETQFKINSSLSHIGAPPLSPRFFWIETQT